MRYLFITSDIEANKVEGYWSGFLENEMSVKNTGFRHLDQVLTSKHRPYKVMRACPECGKQTDIPIDIPVRCMDCDILVVRMNKGLVA